MFYPSVGASVTARAWYKRESYQNGLPTRPTGPPNLCLFGNLTNVPSSTHLDCNHRILAVGRQQLQKAGCRFALSSERAAIGDDSSSPFRFCFRIDLKAPEVHQAPACIAMASKIMKFADAFWVLDLPCERVPSYFFLAIPKLYRLSDMQDLRVALDVFTL